MPPARDHRRDVALGVGQIHDVLVAFDELQLGRSIAAVQLRLGVPAQNVTKTR